MNTAIGARDAAALVLRDDYVPPASPVRYDPLVLHQDPHEVSNLLCALRRQRSPVLALRFLSLCGVLRDSHRLLDSWFKIGLKLLLHSDDDP